MITSEHGIPAVGLAAGDAARVTKPAMSDQAQLAKRYETIHNILFVVETALTLFALIGFLLTGASAWLANAVESRAANPGCMWRCLAEFSWWERS